MSHAPCRSAVRLLLFVFLLGNLSRTLLAQDGSTGAIRGTVVDVLGGRIAGASIALVSTATGFPYSTKSDDDGIFAFQLLPPGDYSARASSQGMSPQVTPNLHVDIGATTKIAFDLSVAGVKETVTVSAPPPLVDTEPDPISYLVDERAITELPLNGRRFTDLALLTPGVTPDPRGFASGANGGL